MQSSYFAHPRGRKNSITDIPGLLVGHYSHMEKDHQTGISLVLPGKNPYRNKLFAQAHIINGFTKPAGLTQVMEEGLIESPIAFTSTHSVGPIQAGLVAWLMSLNPEIGREEGSANALVLECNDQKANDIREPLLGPSHLDMAFENLSEDLEEGAVGGGTGMVCYGFKGGMGSSSRYLDLGQVQGHVGVLLQSNFGSKRDLTILGDKPFAQEEEAGPDKGSCSILIATDLPLLPHQLLRLAKRAQNGIARTGSFVGNGSGDVVLAFSTANVIGPGQDTQEVRMVPSSMLDRIFSATTEAVEEAVLRSLFLAKGTRLLDGTYLPSLAEVYDPPGLLGL